MQEEQIKLTSNRKILTLFVISYLIFIAIIVFIYRNNTISLQDLDELQQKSVLGSEKMLLISRFAEFARNRARYTLQILVEDDPFKQDELNLKIENLASAFAEVRTKLDTMPFTKEDKQIYLSALDLVPEVLPAQRQAVELLMFGGDYEKARELIYSIVLPGQQLIIDKFSNLLHREHEDIKATAALIQNTIADKHNNNNYLYGLVILMLTLLFAMKAMLIVREQKITRDAHANLESMVRERTQELSEARDNALAASRAKSEFLSSMSHELRTPLNAVIGFSQLLETSDNLDHDDIENTHEINKAGNHLLTLINEILDLARIESGNLKIELEAVDLYELISETESLLQSLLEKHNISLDVKLDCEKPVLADHTRLKQVLLNLMSNAIKYNKPQGSVTLQVSCNDNQSSIFFSVSDTGHGIAAEQLQTLFEPFNRLGKENGSIEGTGIGLTITYHIVKMMRSSLHVESTVDEGSRFWFELPVAEEDDKENSI